MKKHIAIFILCLGTLQASAQTIPQALAVARLIPTVQFGFKGGLNLTSLSTSTSANLSSQNQAGYLAGFWFHVGRGGTQFQPEIYLTGKNVALKDTAGVTNNVKFTSIDVPILVSKQIGLIGFGLHFNTGPVISFVIDKNQSVGSALGKITHLEYKDQALAWQFGTGINTQNLFMDLRYEAGISSLSKDGYPDTHVSLFNLTVGYRLF